jgi:protein TonB
VRLLYLDPRSAIIDTSRAESFGDMAAAHTLLGADAPSLPAATNNPSHIVPMQRRSIAFWSVLTSLGFHGLALGALVAAALLALGSLSEEPNFAGRSEPINLIATIADLEPEPLDLRMSAASGVVVMLESAEVAERRFYRQDTPRQAPPPSEALASIEAEPPVIDVPRAAPSQPMVTTPTTLSLRQLPPRQRRAAVLASLTATLAKAVVEPTIKGRQIAPRFFHNPPPTYPAEAYVLRLQGTVLLRLHIAATGNIARVELVKTSGHAVLDAAAASAVRQWRAQPAMRDGRPVATTRLLPVRFKRG